MPNGYYVPLLNRGIVTVEGAEALPFLQGLVSADVEMCSQGRAVWAAMLTPQGKYLFDFFIIKIGDVFWLDCESDRLMDFGRLLHKYKLRADIKLGIGEGMSVYALIDVERFEMPTRCAYFADPRLDAMGKRAILSKDAPDPFQQSEITLGDIARYHALRIENGLPNGAQDMTPEKALLLENGFDELSGIDWNKGCYVGQELTARMKYRGLVKRRLLPVTFDGKPPKIGTDITLDGKNAGEMKSSVDNIGLALLRLERLDIAFEGNSSLMAGETLLKVVLPNWVRGVNR